MTVKSNQRTHRRDVEIRRVADPASCALVEELQRTVWGMPDAMIVPTGQLVAAAKWGGIILLAKDGDRPVGFCYGFHGWDSGPVLCSHMLAVLAEYQGQGIGERLKLAQRDAARGQGLERIVWTFDPLEARNAYLNLHKLGAFAGQYLRDAYGPMTDSINRGLPSDRLVADWRIAADPSPASQGDSTVRIEVPADIGSLKRHDHERAAAWRASAREAFETAFADGYRAVDLLPPGDNDTATYVLTREPR